MSRTVEARMADVRRLLEVARAIHSGRERFVPAIVAATGLTPEGVELGFESLEREASDAELRALVAAAGDAPRVHLVLSANVFVAPFRALVLARAAAEQVTVRASPRDPVLARVLVEAATAAGDRGLVLVDERDVATVESGEIHVYGRDVTLAAIRQRARPHVVVRGHGPGMGVAVVSGAARLDVAASALARDVATFDQRGCLSPRVAFVLGPPEQAAAFADALHDALSALAASVPRGVLAPGERAEARRWRDCFAFAGRVWDGSDHSIALAPADKPLQVPPAGRHLIVVPAASCDAAARALTGIAPHVVAIGVDDPGALGELALPGARLSALGQMQRPPLDGPVDRRRTGSPASST